MKRIGKRILLVGAICAGMYNSTYCLMGMKKNSSPETAFESGVSANNLLSTILVNADLLLQQINNKAYDKAESQKYIKEIHEAQTKLSSELHNAVKPHVSVIEQEFKKYSKLSEPNRKNYDQSSIKQAFKQLRRVIKNAANNTAESVVTSAHETVQRAIAHAEKVTTRATAEINTIRMQLANGEIAPVEAAKKIGEQQHIIMSAEQELKKITEQAQKNVESSDAQASYLSKFAKGAYGLGQTALTQAQLTLGLDHTQEEKDIARAVISQLEEQMAIATVKYKESIRRADLTVEQKAQLDALYNQTMEELNSERYQQQLITGDVMNFNRKLFWGAVAAAGAAGAYLGYQYLTGETDQQQPMMPLSQIPSTMIGSKPATLPVSPVSSVSQQPTIDSDYFDISELGYKPSRDEVMSAVEEIKEPLRDYAIRVSSQELPQDDFSADVESAREEIEDWLNQPQAPEVTVSPMVGGQVRAGSMDKFGRIIQPETKPLEETILPLARDIAKSPGVIQALDYEYYPTEETPEQARAAGRQLREGIEAIIPEGQPEEPTSPMVGGQVRAGSMDKFGRIIQQPETKSLEQGLQEVREGLTKRARNLAEKTQRAFTGSLPGEQTAQEARAEGARLRESFDQPIVKDVKEAGSQIVQEAQKTRDQLRKASERAQKRKVTGR